MWDFRQLRWMYYLGWWWPGARKDVTAYKIFRTYGILLFCLDFLLLGPELINIYYAMENGSLKGMVLNLNTTLIGIVCALMISDLIRHDEDIKWILSTLTDMEERSRKAIDSKYYGKISTSSYNRCQRLAKLVYLFVSTSAQWIVRPIYRLFYGKKVLIVETWVPWDTETTHGWAIIFIIQALHVFVAVFGYCIVFITYISIMELNFGHIDTLKFALTKLDFSYPGVDYHSSTTLRFCVDLHQDILTVCYRLNSIARVTIFISIVFSTVILCLSIFELSSVSQTDIFRLINLLESISCQGIIVFLYCWYCQNTIDEMADVLRAAYSNNWYEGRLSDLRALNIMCSMVEKGVEFTYIIPANLDTFITVLKSAFTYFTFLKAMAHEEQTL